MCKYEGCKEKPNSPHDNEYCIFHAPAGKKGISEREFNRLIFNQIDKKDYSFRGYIFPAGIDFSKFKEFDKEVDFSHTKFEGKIGEGEYEDACVVFTEVKFSGGNADFFGAQFLGGDAYFNGAEFSGGNTYFYGAQFSGGDAVFTGAKFSGGNADFNEAQFSGGNADFNGTQFSGGNAYFNETQFSGGYADFTDAQFSGGDADFTDAQFSGGDADFNGAQFSNDVIFEYNKIKIFVIV
jgi:uncharacterized protein YjbI with pentapeptide repeats